MQHCKAMLRRSHTMIAIETLITQSQTICIISALVLFPRPGTGNAANITVRLEVLLESEILTATIVSNQWFSNRYIDP